MKALVGAFNHEKALVGAFSVIVQPVVEPMEHYTALTLVPLVLDVVGRKPLFVASLFVPGVCCVAAAYLAPGTALFTVLVMGAKLGASAAFNITERVIYPLNF